MSNSMKHYGIIGNPLGHSFSRGYFTEKSGRERLDCVYDNFPIDRIELLHGLVDTHPDLVGLNVTIPYKQAVIPLLDGLDPQAEKIGAVNCIRIVRSGGKRCLIGYNTDASGFEHSLLSMLGDRRPEALVLGTGGASKAVAYVLMKLGIRFRFVSRNGQGDILSYDELAPEVIANYKLIVNTTPLGTYPNVETRPQIPYEGIGNEHFLHDLVYNPAETAFMKQGRMRGAVVKSGYAMLIGQAEKAWEVWNTAL